MWQKLLTEGYWKGEIWDRNKNGDIYPKEMTVTAVKNELGKTTQYVAIFSDITKRKESEETIHNLAFYDALTGIPNRRLLLDRLHAAVLASSRTKKTGALLFLDLDRFKILNDTLGHEVGDLLLIEVAQRLQNCVRAVDTVARFGGDEFVLLLENMGTNQKDAFHNAGHMAEKIHNAIVQPFQLRDHMYECTPSIGVCIFSHAEKDTFDTLLKHADMAMYHAKETGRNKIVFYDPLMQQSLLLRTSLESDLRKAISARELSLYYQIQVDQDNFPIGAEALIRWNHSQRGFISPAEFIPLAEESNLIFDIGDWVIDTACRQLTAWNSNPMTRRLTIAINISAKQFKQPDFVDKLVRVLNSNDFDRSHLKIELTESVALDNLSFAIERMLEIKKTLGIKIAMDDFGIGYSSLSYLRQLPFDQIKIDQSFVRNITLNVGDDIMVKSIIDMTKNLGLHVIAEGVETETQLDFLRKHGCYTYQGYFFGKPMPIEEFEKLLKLQQQPKLIQTKHTVNKK